MASPLTSCHAPKASSRGSKVTTASGTRPPIAEAKSQAPMSKHWPVKPRPIGSNKTCINAHAHTPHSARNTPTRLIRPNKLFFFFFTPRACARGKAIGLYVCCCCCSCCCRRHENRQISSSRRLCVL